MSGWLSVLYCFWVSWIFLTLRMLNAAVKGCQLFVFCVLCCRTSILSSLCTVLAYYLAEKCTLSGNGFVFQTRLVKNELSCLTCHWRDVSATTYSCWLACQQTHLPDKWANSIHWLRWETVEQWTLSWDCAVNLLFIKSRMNFDAQKKKNKKN